MGDDRGRSAAVDRLRTPAHRRFRHAVADRRRRRAVARRLQPRLHSGVRDRDRADVEDRAGRACGGGCGAGGRNRKRPSAAAGSRASRGSSRESDMTALVFDFVPIWTLILGVGVFLYVLLDGFDLGVGILYGFAPNRGARNLVMNSIAPVWDGNETWLVLGGLGLLGAFPLAFTIIIPAVYFPIIIMLLALVFRGVAFEFRFKSPSAQRFWDAGFSIGSAIATLAQGVVLGTFVQGFNVS